MRVNCSVPSKNRRSNRGTSGLARVVVIWGGSGWTKTRLRILDKSEDGQRDRN
jgi:hypothetical protein